jgi:predicted RNA-binding Zn-ribbon protein involved in translation (DUF1610 family)
MIGGKSMSDDLISRQAAIDALKMDISIIPFAKAREYVRAAIETIYNRLEELPTAQPEPHEGHWIKHESPDGGEQYECSECGVLWEFTDGTPEDNEAYFCPKCGAKMIISK